MADTNSLFAGLILGFVEGLTEFLPVSSTGHMVLVGSAIEFTGPLAQSFEIIVQLGAILAVVVLYPERFRALLDFSTNRSSGDSLVSAAAGFTGLTALIKLALACGPAFVLGALFHKTIKSELLAPQPVAYALIVGALLMILVELKKKPPAVHRVEDITYRQALLLGIFQCAALWPGISRSGSMIVGGLYIGIERAVAAEFSFLVAVPVMTAATTYDFMKSYAAFSAGDLLTLAVGFVVAFLTAILGIKFLVTLLQRHTLIPFAVYRIALAALVLALL